MRLVRSVQRLPLPPGGRVLVAAIYDFRARLPWPLFVATQAEARLAVMRSSGRRPGREDARGAGGARESPVARPQRTR